MRKGGPIVDAGVIEALRQRVIAHNSTPGSVAVKLNTLKQEFQRGWRGQDPAARAMAKVDAYLDQRLAKAEPFDESEHPRNQDGEFTSSGGGTSRPGAGGGGSSRRPPPGGGGRVHPSPRPPPLPKVPIDLPTSPEEHAALMSGNRGYQALQTAVIPETRYGTTGAIIRDAGALALGTGLMVGLKRGNLNGLIARKWRAQGGMIGEIGGGLMGAAAHGIKSGTSGAARRLIGRPRTAAEREAARALGTARIKAGAAMGSRGMKRVANFAFIEAGRPIRRIVETAGATGSTRASQAIRRGLALTALAAPVAITTRNIIKDTPFDPAVIGSTIDSYTSRTVRKIAAESGLGELRKAAPYSNLGRAALTGIAAAGAGVVGAGAGLIGAKVVHAVRGSGGKTGNPYHDESGKFTSASKAKTTTRAIIGTGLAGAVAGGLATYFALKSHNTRILAGTAKRLYESANRRIEETTGPARARGFGVKARPSMTERLSRNKASTVAQRVTEALGRSKVLKTAEERAATFGSSDPLRYRAAMTDKLHDRLADTASYQNAFQVPRPGTGAAVWDTVKEIKEKATKGRGKFQEAAAHKRVTDFLKTATDGSFNKATANLTAPEKAAVHEVWDAIKNVPASVDQQLALHHNSIVAAEAKLPALETALETATAKHAAATVAHTAAPAGEVAQAAAQRVSEAAVERNAAQAAHTAAVAAHQTLKTATPTLRTQWKDRVLPKSGDEALAEFRQKLSDKLTTAHSKAFDKEVAAKQSAHIVRLVERKHRQLGAMAALQVRYGATRGALGPPTRALDAAHRAVERAQAKFNAASTEHATSLARQAQLNTITRTGKNPKGMSDELAAELNADPARVAARVTAATTALDDARQTLARAVDTRNVLSGGFESALAAPPPGARHFLPEQVREDLLRDLQMARATVSETTRRLLARPTSQALWNFAKRRGEQVRQAGTELLHHAAYVTPPGQPPQFSWRKTLTTGVPIATGTISTVGAIGGYAWDRLRGGATPFPRSALDYDYKVDPISGAGYAVITVPHPTDPNERMVIFGEHGKDLESPDKRIQAGARMSDVRTAFQQGKIGGNIRNAGVPGTPAAASSGPVSGMDNADKGELDKTLAQLRKDKKIHSAETFPGGPSVNFRDPADNNNESNKAVGLFSKHMQSRFLKAAAAPDYWLALQALGSDQGDVLNPTQAYRMLTNARNEYTHSIFGAAPEWRSGDAAAINNLLSAEIDRAAPTARNADDTFNLHRAVHIAGVARSLSAGQLTGLHDKIRGLAPAPMTASPFASSSGVSGAAVGAAPLRTGVANFPMPAQWAGGELRTRAGDAGRRLAAVTRATYTGASQAYSLAVSEFAKTVAHEYPALKMPDAVKVAHDAVLEAVRAGAGGASPFGDPEGYLHNNPYFNELLNQTAIAHIATINKLDDLNDLDAILEKAFGGQFDETKHTRHGKGSDQGGEFSSKGASARPSARKERVPDYHPLRAAQDLSSAAGMQAAWEAARRVLPTAGSVKAAVAAATTGGADAGLARRIGDRMLAGAAGAGTAVGTGGLKLAAGFAGGAGALGLAQAGLHAAGYKLPGESEKPSLGRDLAGTVGAVAGGFAGTVAGLSGGPAAFATAVAGSWAGQIAGQHLYDWFSPYGASQTARAAGRFVQKAISG